ncbi:MAG: HD-GYP domain-containing protein, partial [Phycisphaeraceae bacterium]
GTHPSAAVFLGDIADAEDDLMRHCSSVTYLALLLGMKLEGYIVRERKHIDPARAKDLANLGVGAMLHDIGVLLLPPAVRERHRESGDDHDPQWREHPTLGFQHVRGRIEPSAATVVLNHHQRADGSGYAGKTMPVLADKAMHVYARIAAVADHFDALRRPVGVPPQPTVWALSAMLSDTERDKFDPAVLRALIESVPAYPPGTIVRLSDGQHAVAIDHNPIHPCRPTVQIIPDPNELDPNDLPFGDRIDLSELNAGLYVAEAEGHDVSELNFGAEVVRPLLQAA